MRNIVVTGATGLVASAIINHLINVGEYNVLCVSSRPKKCKELFTNSEKLSFISNEEFLSKEFFLEIDTLIHCAFTRKNDSKEVATSMLFSKQIFEKAKDLKAKSVFYTSTRSIYKEPNEGELNTENSPIVPSALIGIAKYGVELIMEAMFSNSDSNYCILRLASVNELKSEEVMRRPINIFVENVLQGQPIKVKGGMQVMSYIDPEDISTAIISLINLPKEKRNAIYNIGSGWLGTKKLSEIASTVLSIGTQEFGYPSVDIETENVYVNQHAGLDISQIKEDTGWEPKVGIDEMIRRVFKLLISTNSNENE